MQNRYAILGICLSAWIFAACTTTGAEQSADIPVRDRSNDIVIAADDEGVGTSWASVTDSPLARTAAELSNLGGTPLVLGAVGVVMAADAAPRGRARRLSVAMNAGIDPDALDDDLAEKIEEALPDALEASEGEVRTKTFERRRDLTNEGYIISTEYALAKDGTALRVTAEIVHADVLQVEEEMRREWERMENSQSQNRMMYDNRRLRRLKREWNGLQSLYRGRIIYHSDPVDLPSLAAADPTATKTVNAITDIIEAEHAARLETAQARYDNAMAQATKPKHESKAQRRLDKALAKAEKLRAEGLEKAQDEEMSKMEVLLIAMQAWDVNDPETPSRLLLEIEEAHNFIAQALAAELTGSDTSEAFPTAEKFGDQPLPSTEDMDVLARAADGRLIYLLKSGPNAGTLINAPRTGTAEYGGSLAKP